MEFLKLASEVCNSLLDSMVNECNLTEMMFYSVFSLAEIRSLESSYPVPDLAV